MARESKQRLINYHTPSSTNMPLTGDVRFGEIVVRHNATKPELLIKVSSGTTGQEGYGEWFVPFMASEAVTTAIAAAIENLEGTTEASIADLTNIINAVSGTVTSDYALSAITQAVVDAAKIEAEIASSAYTDSEIAKLSGVTSAYVESQLSGVTNDVSTLKQKVTALENFSGYVENNYATSADTVAAIEAARASAVDSAYTNSTAYTDQQITWLSGVTKEYVNDQITGVTGDISGLESRVVALENFSGKVETDYATKEEVATAKAEAVDSAYTNARTNLIGVSTDEPTADTIWGAKNYAKGVSGDVITYVDGQLNTTNANVTTVSGNVVALSGAVASMSGDVSDYIDQRLSTVYKFKGSVSEYGNLPNNAENGDVYNMLNEYGTFGEEGYYPAGTNFAWVEDSGVTGGGYWDALGGQFDYTDLATQGELDAVAGRVSTLESATGTLDTKITTVSGNVEALSASVVTKYATSADTVAAIEDAKIAAEIASSAYTDSQINMLSGVTSAYVASQLSTISSDVSDLKRDSATHTEVATQSAATFNSAYTAAVASAESYTDTTVESAVSTLKGDVSESGATLGALEDRIDDLESLVGTDTTSLDQRLTTVEGKLTNSADTWNAATQGAEFGAVTSSSPHYDGGEGSGATVDSNAKLSYTEGGKIVLDFSELIIDGGEF